MSYARLQWQLQCLAVVVLWLQLAAGVGGAPWSDGYANYDSPQSQVCGDKLANAMALVCSGRGYNNPFRPEHSGTRRFRRQIVEECCRRSCNPALLKLYCQADPADALPDTLIRKRSDTDLDSTEKRQDIGDLTSTTEPQPSQTISVNYLRKGNRESSKDKKNRGSYKLLNLLEPTEQIKHKYRSKNAVDRSTENDTIEDFKQDKIPPLRHRKNHHHAGHKTKRGKNFSGEGRLTFLIGTVKPYLYRSNSIHRGHSHTHAQAHAHAHASSPINEQS